MNESRMSSQLPDSREERLDALFRAYRVACEPPETSVNFMPELWQKIEQTQNATFSFRRIAKGFVTAAVALSMVLAIIGFVSSDSQNSPADHASYVEALAAHNEALDARNSMDSVEYVLDLIHPDSVDDAAEEI
jgi:hypothetical protein